MTAVAYVEFGELEKATKYFAQSYANIHPPFNVWLETPSGGTPMFITGFLIQPTKTTLLIVIP